MLNQLPLGMKAHALLKIVKSGSGTMLIMFMHMEVFSNHMGLTATL
jgi:hypothetical protein